MKNSRTHAHKKQLSVWDAVSGLSVCFGQFLNTVLPSLIPYLKDQELLARLADRPRFDRLVASLERDLRRVTHDYRELREAHVGRKGNTENPDEVMQSIDLFERYMAWGVNYDDTITPTLRDLIAMLQAAGAETSDIPVQSAVMAAEAVKKTSL